MTADGKTRAPAAQRRFAPALEVVLRTRGDGEDGRPDKQQERPPSERCRDRDELMRDDRRHEHGAASAERVTSPRASGFTGVTMPRDLVRA